MAALGMKVLPWFGILAMLSFSLWARYALVEPAEFGFYCDAGGGGRLCALRWMVVQSFSTYGLGYFGLFLGVLATLTRSGLVALLAGMAGVAGLVLYTWDYSAVAFLLGVLTLARAEDEGQPDGTGQHQT